MSNLADIKKQKNDLIVQEVGEKAIELYKLNLTKIRNMICKYGYIKDINGDIIDFVINT